MYDNDEAETVILRVALAVWENSDGKIRLFDPSFFDGRNRLTLEQAALRMVQQGMMSRNTLDGTYELTAFGVCEAESRGLGSEASAKYHDGIRKIILLNLADRADGAGDPVSYYYDDLAQENELNSDAVLKNLHLLASGKLVEEVRPGFFIISE